MLLVSHHSSPFTDVSSLLNTADSLLSLDDEAEEAPVKVKSDAAAGMPTLTLNTMGATFPASNAVDGVGSTPLSPTLASETTLQQALASGIPANMILLINPTGLHNLFIPGGISLDGCVQVMYIQQIHLRLASPGCHWPALPCYSGSNNCPNVCMFCTKLNTLQ